METDDLEVDSVELAELADAILEGRPVDWVAVEAGSREPQRPLIQQLRVLAEVVTLHRSLPALPSAVDAVEPERYWAHLKILERIGHGAFGEVFRAWDSRLDREVALKLLRPVDSASADPGTSVIEEGRLLARVRHPNVITVYGAERIGDQVGLWTELIRGQTLEQLIREKGPFSAQEATAVGIDLCRALSAVHRAGLLHRDIKAHNVMREEGGRIVLMDFGAGRVWEEGGATADFATGTPLYLAPEVLQGQPATARSDIYGLSVLLFHLVTGSYPIIGRSLQEIREAHLRGRRNLLRDARPDLPEAFVDAVEVGLRADPAQRYERPGALEAAFRKVQGTRDAARGSPRRRRLIAVTVGAGILTLVLGGALLVRRLRSGAPATSSIRFSQVTFDEQAISEARFAPGSETFVYGAYRLTDQEVKPPDLFVARLGSPESRPLGIPEGRICSISPAGQMAFLIRGGTWVGTLAQAALEGGSPRSLLENVRHADWSPDGKALAVVHTVDGRDRLEFPIGNVLYESPTPTLLLGSSIFDCRVSPKGDSVAFFDREARQLSIVDDHKKVTRLLKGGAWIHFAWSPRGDEVWYAKFEGSTELRGVTPAGRDRFLMALPGDFQLQDISRSGRILLEKRTRLIKVFGRLRGDPEERDLAYRSATEPVDLSADGSRFVFNEVVPGWASDSMVCLREAGKPPVPLGKGFARALSPDGKWVIASPDFPGSQLVLLPTGAGESRKLPRGSLKIIGLANWLPDGIRIVFAARAAGEDSRLYVQDVAAGDPRPITPEGVSFSPRGGTFVSPDGKFVVAKQSPTAAPTGQTGFLLYPLDGGDPRPVRGLVAPEVPIQWSEDGNLFVDDQQGTAFLIDPVSGRRKPWMKIPPPEPTHFYGGVVLARDGKSYVRGSVRFSSNLFVLDGIR